MTEEVTVFGDEQLVGILSRPSGLNQADLPGVILLNPGLLHRVGPNRLYVKLARSLAAEGFNVLRFDFSGQGDSPPRVDHLPRQQSAVEETRAAINYLFASTGCSQAVLIGHCSGALYSFLAAYDDHRVTGMIAISIEGGDEDWVEFDRRQKESRYYARYYRQAALTDPARWRRLFTGQANYSSIVRTLFHNVFWYRISTMWYRRRSSSGASSKDAGERPDVKLFKEQLHALVDRNVSILIVHPDQSAGRELLRAVLGDTIDQLCASGAVQRATISDSDHLFMPLAAQRELVETIRTWTLETYRSVPLVSAGSSR